MFTNPYFAQFKNLQPEEIAYLQNLTASWDQTRLQQFAMAYGSRRKDSETILILTLLGFIGISGIQRFMLDQVGMGILYLLTGGLCAVGTIVDLINYKKMTAEYNMQQAHQVALMMSGGAPTPYNTQPPYTPPQ